VKLRRREFNVGSNIFKYLPKTKRRGNAPGLIIIPDSECTLMNDSYFQIRQQLNKISVSSGNLNSFNESIFSRDQWSWTCQFRLQKNNTQHSNFGNGKNIDFKSKLTITTGHTLKFFVLGSGQPKNHLGRPLGRDSRSDFILIILRLI
jgi:hypothetical protein